MSQYKWAVNSWKLDRAVEALTKTGKKFNEADVKKEYVKLGGLVKEIVVEKVAVKKSAPKKVAAKKVEGKK